MEIFAPSVQALGSAVFSPTFKPPPVFRNVSAEKHFRRQVAQTRIAFEIFLRCAQDVPIAWVRIRAACKELRKTNISVNEIAMRSGFTTISTFNRNFRRILGVSPQQWRSAPEHYERKLLNFDIKTQEGW